MDVKGLCELCGSKGSGRTNLALSESCARNTAYVSSSFFPMRRYLRMKRRGACGKTLFVAEVRSVAELWFLVKHRLGDLARKEALELVVIDALDHLLHTEARSRALYAMLVELVRELKTAIHRHGVGVLVLNAWQPSRKVGAGEWSLGLSWSYLVHTRFLVRRTPTGRLCECLVSVTGARPRRRFAISDEGVEFLGTDPEAGEDVTGR